MNIHLTDFDESERADYMTVVASMAAVDGVISSEELLCLRELCKNFVLGPSARGQVLAAASSPPHDFEDIVRRLGHSSLRYSLLVDVAGMAFRDDVITDEERKEYKRLSDLMGVSEEHSKTLWEFAESQFSPGYTPAKAAESIEKLESKGVSRGCIRMSACMMALGMSTPLEVGR